MKIHRATACPHITQDDLDKARTELALALEMPATRKQTFTHCGSNLLHYALTLDLDLKLKSIQLQNLHICICMHVHTYASAAKGCRNHAAVRCHKVLCKVHCVSACASSGPGPGPGAGCKFHQTRAQLQLNAQRYWHRRR